MKEIEVKFRVKDFSRIHSKLRSLGAHLIWKGMEDNIFFDTKDRQLYKKGILFRLRRWNNHSVVLTVKTTPVNKSKKFKIKKEYEIEVGDFEMTQKLIETLGFLKDFQYRKFREHWRLSDTFIELDTVGRMYFVEIEGAQKAIYRAARAFDLNWKHAERRGYVTLLKGLRR
ncbi:MAG: class IV adenylate cyclase [Candidatus Niyogibacteria bacterium]|nr:class IV adenylate cyclase [Candidatus Niyogibacteria bacterium]